MVDLAPARVHQAPYMQRARFQEYRDPQLVVTANPGAGTSSITAEVIVKFPIISLLQLSPYPSVVLYLVTSDVEVSYS